MNTIQLIGIYVVGGCLVLIAGTFIVDWRNKREIDRIPDLLAVLDQLTLEYIDAFEPDSVPENVMDGLAKVLGIEIGGIKAAVRDGNKTHIELEYPRLLTQYNRVTGKKTSDTLQNLLMMSGFLNESNVGLKQVTNTPRYRHLHNRIKSLQRRAPSAEINIKVNDYWKWSEGLYSSLLSSKPTLLMAKDLIPPKIIASTAIMRPLFEEQTAVLISAVRESIENYKNRHRLKDTDAYGKKK